MREAISWLLMFWGMFACFYAFSELINWTAAQMGAENWLIVNWIAELLVTEKIIGVFVVLGTPVALAVAIIQTGRKGVSFFLKKLGLSMLGVFLAFCIYLLGILTDGVMELGLTENWSLASFMVAIPITILGIIHAEKKEPGFLLRYPIWRPSQ